ncbi:subtilisin DY [Abditibacteriota bacterium]|nr:subtilisin DY [Abditibacteriota bacterium]
MKRNRNARDAFLYLLESFVSTYFRPRAGNLFIVKSNFSHPRILAALGAVFSVALGASGASAQSKTPSFDTHSILVLSTSTNSTALTTRGLRVTNQYKNVGWSQVALAPGADVAKTVAALRAQGLQVEPNYIQHFLKTPNDPLYSGQWDMEKIGAPAAWNITTGGTELVGGGDVVVAILDSGITPNHPDLKANLYVNKGEIGNNGKDDDGNGYVDDVNGYDFAQDNGVPDDGNSHGTHVAGTVGAVGNNRLGVTGINWRVKLLACRVGTDEGAIFTSAVISALDYIVGLKKAGVNIRVANHSYGGYQFSQAEFAAFQRASAAGILNVCAAGNDGYNNEVAPLYPASFRISGLISVAASDQDDKLAEFSNVGGRSVALAAPGVDILSTFPPGHEQSGSLYGLDSGTSMASPHVAGALALLLSQTPTLSMQQAQARLYATVDKLPQLSGKVSTGGRLNLAKLLGTGIYGVSGRVLRSNNTPVAGVTVSIRGTGILTTTTDSNGFYRFSALPLGTYTLSAKLAGFNFAAAKGSSLTFTFTNSVYALTENILAVPSAATYAVFGTTYNAFGKIQPGVQIFANGSPQALAVSDAKGAYTIDDLVAGKYSLTALYRGVTVFAANSNQSVKDVELPATFGTSAPNVRVDWQVPPIDNVAPTLKLTSPIDGQDYPQGQLKAIAGNAYDNDQLSTVEFTLYQYQAANNQTTYIPYNWTTGEFDPTSSQALPKVITLKGASAAFNIALPDLPVADYYLFTTVRDRTGNSTGQIALFSVTTGTQPVPSPTQSPYPRFTFNYPYANAVVRNLSAFTATGTAHSDNGVQSLNFYLQQVDERGSSIAYYDWVNKRWVSAQDGTTTLTQNFNGGTDVKWSLPIPALQTGRYVLYGYGVALDGSQPPVDGSLDDNVVFRAGTNPSAVPAAASSTPKS